MNAKGSGKKPLRRGGSKGRQEPRREPTKGPGRLRDDNDEKNWTKKFQEGELDDLLVTGEEEDDQDAGTDEDDLMLDDG